MSGGSGHPTRTSGFPPAPAPASLSSISTFTQAGGSGFAAFERARSEGLADTWGWLVRTPSGGIHAYCPAGPDHEQRSWQVPSAHVDFRGDGGYVIAPPSRLEVDGAMRPYDVIAVATHTAKPVDAVQLRRLLEPPRPRPVAPPSGLPSEGCRPEALARVVALTPEGGRNRALFWASCRMAEDGHSHANAVSYLMAAAQYAGLPDREIESTIESAFRIASRLGPGSRLGPTQRKEAIQL